MTTPQDTTWVLEAGVFPETHAAMAAAVKSASMRLVEWDDAWWRSGDWPRLDCSSVFHGSLGNADRIARELPWRPGAYCKTEAFRCSSWYLRAEPWLLHRTWRATTVASLVESPANELAFLTDGSRFFVRPDSPLKPFSGRVVPRERLSLSALDHGYYYDDATLPIIVAPVRNVTREWRYVVVERRVVAGSAYLADRRTHEADSAASGAWRFAADVSRAMEPPEAVYVLDVCEADGELRLLELNPFSGADLYSCDRAAVVEAVSIHAGKHR